jgi:SAM-dependent methyltransferase
MYEDSIKEEFTRQSASFGRSAAMTSAQTLGALVETVPEDLGSHWIDVACGPGLISRAIADRVGSVQGIDLTPAMVEEAALRAGEEGAENVSFAVGDATSLDFADATFDGAVTRLSLHHVPAPARVVSEMARVVRPGGTIVISDLAADSDRDASAWREEIERLRDPSHWACLPPERLAASCAAVGLVLDDERIVQVDIDFDEWLERGSGGGRSAPLIQRLLDEQPATADAFRVVTGDSGRRLLQDYWLARGRRPD